MPTLGRSLEVCSALVWQLSWQWFSPLRCFSRMWLHFGCYGGSSLPVVRYLVNCTEAAVLASVAPNHKLRKPIDIAEKVDFAKWRNTKHCARDDKDIMFCTSCRQSHYSSYVTVEVYRILLGTCRCWVRVVGGCVYARVVPKFDHVHVVCSRETHAPELLKGCNMRLKIQKGKKRRQQELARHKRFVDDLRDRALRDAQAMLMRTKEEFVRQVCVCVGGVWVRLPSSKAACLRRLHVLANLTLLSGVVA